MAKATCPSAILFAKLKHGAKRIATKLNAKSIFKI